MCIRDSAYCLCFLMAYYGPNATILGNVKNGYWQYSAVTNIDTTIMWIGIMFFIDFGSTILSAFLLFHFCKLNIFKMYLLLQKEMWHVLSVHQCYLVEEVCFNLDICASNTTHSFICMSVYAMQLI